MRLVHRKDSFKVLMIYQWNLICIGGKKYKKKITVTILHRETLKISGKLSQESKYMISRHIFKVRFKNPL